MDLELQGKVVLITGGSAGLGKALAKVLAAEGANVAICARGEEKLKQAADEIGGNVFAQAADVSKTEDITNFVEAAAKNFGGIDGVVNNAGTGAAFQFQDVTDEQWQNDYDLKVLAAVRTSRAALPYLKKSGSAAIVNVANSTGKSPRMKSLPTSMSRAAGINLTKAMSIDLAEFGIRVNVVCNGFFHTDQWAINAKAAGKSEQELVDFLIKTSAVPAGRFGDPEEWAKVTAFLLSPAASYINGTALNVDGGLAPVV